MTLNDLTTEAPFCIIRIGSSGMARGSILFLVARLRSLRCFLGLLLRHQLGRCVAQLAHDALDRADKLAVVGVAVEGDDAVFANNECMR